MTYQHRANPDWSVLEDITWYLVKISFEKQKFGIIEEERAASCIFCPPSVYWTFRQLDRSIASHDWIKFHILITVCHKTKKQIDNDQYCREKTILILILKQWISCGHSDLWPRLNGWCCLEFTLKLRAHSHWSQGCINRGMCSHPELTQDQVLTSAYVIIFCTVATNAVNKSVWRKKDCSWLPFNKHAINIFI